MTYDQMHRSTVDATNIDLLLFVYNSLVTTTTPITLVSYLSNRLEQITKCIGI